MTKISIGKFESTGAPATLEMDTLMSSRLLGQANSGGGKSYLLRKLIEEAFGKVPIILFDHEGEFPTLREKFPFILIGSLGDGADVQISIKTAPLLPRKLLELGASAIIDMSELKKHERPLFVRRFCEALMELPKELWMQYVIAIDEIHIFCPEHDKAESMAAVVDVATRGRKRGFCLWGFTQRISKFAKDAAAELNNKLVGRCSLDIDRKRGAAELGFTTQKEELSLRELNPGEFYAYGPAFEKGVNKLKVSEVKTTHPKMGQRVLVRATPQPEKIKHILSALASIQGEAEKKAKTEEEYKKEIATMRGQLLAAQNAAARAPAKTIVKTEQVFVVPEIALEMASLEAATQALIEVRSGLRAKIKARPNVQLKTETASVQNPLSSTQFGGPPLPPPSTDDKLPSGAMRMLEAVASFHPKPVSKAQLGTLIGMVFTGGTFNRYLQDLVRAGWIEHRLGILKITSGGMTAAGDFRPISRNPADLLSMWKSKFPTGAAKMLQIIADRHPGGISKEELGSSLDMAYSGGTFNRYLQDLKRSGLVKSDGVEITASDELFPE